MDQFEIQLRRMMDAQASEFSRYCAVQGFKSFALAHIAALQGAVAALPEGDATRDLAQAALDEITTILMDR